MATASEVENPSSSGTKASHAVLPSGRKELDTALLRGVAWTSVGRWLFQGLNWVVSLAVARILAPDDYGIAGMALVYIGLVQLVSELGLGAALIQRRQVAEHAVRRLHSFAVAMGFGLALVSVPAGLALSAFYNEPRLFSVVAVYGLNFVASGFRSLPQTLLTRDFQFKTLAAVTVVEGLAASLTTLALAMQGLGYWSLVLGHSCATWLAAAAVYSRRPIPLTTSPIGRDDWHLVTFGLNLTAGRIGWYFYSSADLVIVGRVLGTTQLGFYALASQLAAIPLERIAGAVTQVLFPVLSAVKDDNRELRRYFRGLVELLALVMLPATVGMALVSPDLFHGLLGSKWSESVMPFALLALATNSRLVSNLVQQVLLAKGEARFLALLTAIAAMAMPAVFLAAARYGISAVALTWLIVHPVLLLTPSLVKARRAAQISLAEISAAALPALLATTLMVVVVGSLSLKFIEARSTFSLGMLIGAGVLSYGSVLVLFHRRRLRELALMVARTGRSTGPVS